MASGASRETELGALHSHLTAVFQKILDRYAARLDAIDTVSKDEIEDEFIKQFFDESALPSPAMLSAVSKFLKDNEISFDTEQLDELSATEKRLQDRRALRKGAASLTNLKVVGEDG